MISDSQENTLFSIYSTTKNNITTHYLQSIFPDMKQDSILKWNTDGVYSIPYINVSQ